MMGPMGGPNMGPGNNMGAFPPGGMPGGPRGMGPRGQGFQQIPPSGPMMRQQAPGPMGPGGPMQMGPGGPVPTCGMPVNSPGDMQQRMRFPSNAMMGPGGPGGPQGGPQGGGPGGGGPGGNKVPVSHPSPQHSGSPGPGMWNSMGSPNPNNMQMGQQQSIGSPRTPGMDIESCHDFQKSLTP